MRELFTRSTRVATVLVSAAALLSGAAASAHAEGPGGGGVPASAGSVTAVSRSRVQVREAGPLDRTLRTLPSGVVLLDSPAPTSVAVRPVAGSIAWTWHPASALPVPESRGRRVDVFYTPHPDDETLSMGVMIDAAVRRGDRVIVVSLTDGRTTGAANAINVRLAQLRVAGAVRTSTPSAEGTAAQPGGLSAPLALSASQIAAARVGELRRAAADLGIAAQDVFLAHLDAPDSDGGELLTVVEATAVMRAFAAQFPAARHVTMSNVVERQLDHLAAGTSLRQLADAGVIASAAWTVSRLWWQQAGPPWTWVLPDDTGRATVRRAAKEYLTWDPTHGEYAVGFYSVRNQFAALLADTRDRVHGTATFTAG
jgi:LmbE family N-acetylglucosaminyl deacetylase